MGPTSKGEEEGMVGRGGEGAVEEREGGGRKGGREKGGEGRGRDLLDQCEIASYTPDIREQQQQKTIY